MKCLLAICAGLTLTNLGCSQAPRPLATVRVEGRVVDSLGNAVALAQVVAATPRGGVEVARVQADGDGSFVLPKLPRIELVLRAMAARRIADPYRLELDERPWCEVEELPVLLRMIDAVTVRGCVKDEHGKPLAAARVMGEAIGEDVAWRTPRVPFVETDTLGRFEVPVPFGRTRVCTLASNHGFVVEQLTLTDDETLDFTLRSCPSCELRIRYRGATAWDLDWMAFCDDGQVEPDLWQIWPQTRKDESVTFHGLPVGSALTKFRLFFVPHGIDKTNYIVPGTPGPHDIEAPTSPWMKSDDPLVELCGRLVDTDGKPIRGSRLTRWVSPQQTDAAPTGDDGQFRLSIRTTMASLWIGLEGDDYVPVSPRHERHAGDYAFNNFDVPTDGKQELVLVAEKAAAITGRLLDDGDRPVWGALVQIQAGTNVPAHASVGTLTDREGRFTLRGLRASSKFTVWLRAASPTVEFATEKLHLRVGETLALGDLRAGKPNVIEGQLRDGGGGARPGTLLTLQRDATARAYDSWRHGFTDRLGRFRFSGLPEGSYMVRLGGPRGRGADWPIVGDATVAHGESVDLGGR